MWSEGGEDLMAARHLELVPSLAAASLLTGAHLRLVWYNGGCTPHPSSGTGLLWEVGE